METARHDQVLLCSARLGVETVKLWKSSVRRERRWEYRREKKTTTCFVSCIESLQFINLRVKIPVFVLQSRPSSLQGISHAAWREGRGQHTCPPRGDRHPPASAIVDILDWDPPCNHACTSCVSLLSKATKSLLETHNTQGTTTVSNSDSWC